MIDSGDQKLLLLAGPIGVGKSSVTEILASEYGFRRISSGRHLARLLEESGIEPNRNSLVELGDKLDVDTDFKWVVQDVAGAALASQPEHLLWIFDSVRKRKQVEHFRRRAPRYTCLVYLSANEETLHHRYNLRHRNSDQLTSYETAIDSDNEREARGLDEVSDIVLQTDNISPAEIARHIWGAFSAWPKLLS